MRLTRSQTKLIRLRWWMTIALQSYSPQEVARMVQDDLKISPEEVRLWLLKPFRKSGRGAKGPFGIPFKKNTAE
jgi:hypothetical protein